MTTSTQLSERRLQAAHEDLNRLRQALQGVIIGQAGLIEELIIALFAGGHVLIEGLPGDRKSVV